MAKLFTPGPLNTSDSVKRAMLVDVGSRDTEFIETVKYIREHVVTIAGGLVGKHVCVPLQGSGSFAVQAVLDNVIGRSRGKALIIANGAYGYRMIQMCEQASYSHVGLKFAEENPIDLSILEEELKAHGADYALVATVQSETSTGIFNDIPGIARLVNLHTTAIFMVDAMSSLGAVPIDMEGDVIHFVVSSANKCLQGVPGFSYVIADEETLKGCRGTCTSWAFDLCAQLDGLESNGQFRCTPPTHAILAFRQALREFYQETFQGRIERYRNNNRIIREGMKKMGFRVSDEHIPEDKRGYIITPFFYPKDPKFDFMVMYNKLSERHLVIYPGKTTKADTFRLGNIGDLHAEDCETLIKNIEIVLGEMGVEVPVKN